MPPAGGADVGNVAVKTACLSFKLRLIVGVVVAVVVVAVVTAVTVSVLKEKDSILSNVSPNVTTESTPTNLSNTTLPGGDVTGSNTEKPWRTTTTGTISNGTISGVGNTTTSGSLSSTAVFETTARSGQRSTEGSSSNATVTGGSTESPLTHATSAGITETTVAPSLCPEGFERTFIFIQLQTMPGQKVFFRGGLDYSRVTGRCPSNVNTTNPCVIPIKHVGTSSDPAYAMWSKGDNFLDWYGSESSQGRYAGFPADGTPSVNTTNRVDSPSWHTQNTYGDNYWMADLCMNCNRTVSGWFEVKSVVNGSWGGDITQVSPCEGTAPLSERSSSFTSTNHIGRCGRANLFIRNSASCIINDVDFRYTPRVTQPTTVRDTTVGTRVSSTTNEISTTSAPSCPSGLTRTVNMVKSSTTFGQNVFIRGGNEHTRVAGRCQSLASDSNPCNIKIAHRDPPINSAYAAWSLGDNYLDWYGPERGQGQYKNVNADGSPMIWSTNDNTSSSWNALNKFGANYWLADMCMNCSQTVSGWFEFKSVITGSQWESDVTQVSTCEGSASISERTRPFTSGNHIGHCGNLNVFVRGSGSCLVDAL